MVEDPENNKYIPLEAIIAKKKSSACKTILILIEKLNFSKDECKEIILHSEEFSPLLIAIVSTDLDILKTVLNFYRFAFIDNDSNKDKLKTQMINEIDQKSILMNSIACKNNSFKIICEFLQGLFDTRQIHGILKTVTDEYQRNLPKKLCNRNSDHREKFFNDFITGFDLLLRNFAINTGQLSANERPIPNSLAIMPFREHGNQSKSKHRKKRKYKRKDLDNEAREGSNND